MNAQDERIGKSFTHVYSTQGISVIIQTSTHNIHGNLHLRENERIKDALNTSEHFVAITDATVFDLPGKTLLYKAEFLAINLANVEWVIEDDRNKEEANS